MRICSYTKMDSHKHDEVCHAVRDEDPEIKKEYRELDNKDLSSIYHDGSFQTTSNAVNRLSGYVLRRMFIHGLFERRHSVGSLTQQVRTKVGEL